MILSNEVKLLLSARCLSLFPAFCADSVEFDMIANHFKPVRIFLPKPDLELPFYVDYLPRQERSEKALFPGITVVLLAGLGLMVGSRRGSPDEQVSEKRVIWFFFAGLTAIGFLLSLGPELQVGNESYTLPYRYLYRYAPGFRGMRVPARLSILVWVGLGVLSGMGLSKLLTRFPRRQCLR